jgi:hypothetical protein
MQTENRYSRQLRRYAFALRLIQHNARTQTILAWSGLSTYRVRTLYRADGPDQGDPGRRRPRGRPPYQLQFFWRSAKRADEAAVLGGIARLLNVIPEHPIQKGSEVARSLQQGERVCVAYELWHAFIPDSEISIDHAFLLVTALARGDEVRLGHCLDCKALILVDCLRPAGQMCESCETCKRRHLLAHKPPEAKKHYP